METFAHAVQAVEKKCTALLKSPRFKMNGLPLDMPEAGVYVFSKGKRVLYVGRTNNLKRRVRLHTRKNHNQATFAFLSARKKTGMIKPSYKKSGSRSDLMNHRDFRDAFDKAIMEIRRLTVQFIAEADANRQALLEICVVMRTKAELNKFDNH